MLLFTKFRLISAKNSNAIECDIFNINLCEILNKNQFLCPKIQYGSLFINYLASNKNIIMSSFKSSRDIQKKEGGPDSCFG